MCKIILASDYTTPEFQAKMKNNCASETFSEKSEKNKFKKDFSNLLSGKS